MIQKRRTEAPQQDTSAGPVVSTNTFLTFYKHLQPHWKTIKPDARRQKEHVWSWPLKNRKWILKSSTQTHVNNREQTLWRLNSPYWLQGLHLNDPSTMQPKWSCPERLIWCYSTLDTEAQSERWSVHFCSPCFLESQPYVQFRHHAVLKIMSKMNCTKMKKATFTHRKNSHCRVQKKIIIGRMLTAVDEHTG